MSEIHSKKVSRLLAGGAVLALSLAGAVTLSGPAFAANGNIDPDATGSITIHKHESPNDGTANNPGDANAVDPTVNKPIAGVTFTVCKINGGAFDNVLASNNTFWDAVKVWAPGSTPAGTSLDCSYGPVVTNAAGIATTATNLPLGAYVVTETDAPSNVVTKADPFIVTVPSPEDHTDLNGGWVYNVHAYPKNSVAEGPRKDIVHQDDQNSNGVKLGDPITYNVTTKLPSLEDDITKFIISDTLDSKLDPDTDLSKVVVKPFGGTAFVQGTDYDAVWAGQKLTVTFKQPGFDKLNALPAGTNIVLEFVAAANAIGEIDNIAYVNVNDIELDSTPNGPEGNPTNVVKTRWGAAEFVKVDKETPTTTLGGAQFEVYMSNSDAAGCATTPLNQLTQVKNSDGTNYTLTSESTGTVKIPGLWVGDTELVIDDKGNITNVTKAGHDLTQRCYVLVETVAPAGYILPPAPENITEFVVTTGGTVQLDGMDTITNKQQGVPELPLTGAAGQLLMVLGGASILAIAIGAALVARRRNQAAENAAL